MNKEYLSKKKKDRELLSKSLKTFRVGPIRPPSEAESLLLQITEGCTWNKCKFCNLYRNTQFRAFSVESIKADIDAMYAYADLVWQCQGEDGNWDMPMLNQKLRELDSAHANCFYMVATWLISGGKTVFLQDGNSLALSNGRLTEVLKYLKEIFPQIERITSYGRGADLAKISKEEFKSLREAGLTRIHSGYESGSDQVLQLVQKGVTSQELIAAGQNIKGGGIELSVYFMPGLGGQEFSEENAKGMANVINKVNPDFVRIRTTAIKEGTELYEDYANQTLTIASEDDKIKEIKTLIEESKNVDTILKSDHVVNLLQEVEGSLKKDKEKLLGIISQYQALPLEERKIFQLGRRTGVMLRLEESKTMGEAERKQYKEEISKFASEAEWDKMINDLTGRYI